ncbi:MAG: hypothetical protein IJ817_01150 [Clostridia bacterium]|nr:hypothetical protein [Clostridia bacterium]
MINNCGNDLIGVIKDYLAELDIREIITERTLLRQKSLKLGRFWAILVCLISLFHKKNGTEIAKEKRKKRRKARMEKKAAERDETESLPKLPKRIRENFEIEQLMLKNHMEEDEEW